MGILYGDIIWGYYMEILYGDIIWGYIYGDIIWRILYGDIIWRYYMGILYGDIWLPHNPKTGSQPCRFCPKEFASLSPSAFVSLFCQKLCQQNVDSPIVVLVQVLLLMLFLQRYMNFSFTVTSSEYLCLGDLVQLSCSAQVSATWTSDDILGPDQSITFDSLDSINTPVTVGNGTAVLIEKSPRIVTSLSFNLTTNRVKANCTNNQLRTTTTISSVQPGEFQVLYLFVVV